MNRIREQLTSRENLVWAWQKAKRLYDSADGPVDWGAITAFELDLERQLDAIAKDFTNLKYRLTPLILLPQPKKPDDDGNPRLRQSFHVAVRDQVAWLALVNVIGPTLDAKIPPWVYGHRLYKAAWFEEEENQEPRLALGPYRHSTGALYRKFKHSWPLFRRHISLTARRMVNAIPHEEQLDQPHRGAALPVGAAQRPTADDDVEPPEDACPHRWPGSPRIPCLPRARPTWCPPV